MISIKVTAFLMIIISIIIGSLISRAIEGGDATVSDSFIKGVGIPSLIFFVLALMLLPLFNSSGFDESTRVKRISMDRITIRNVEGEILLSFKNEDGELEEVKDFQVKIIPEREGKMKLFEKQKKRKSELFFDYEDVNKEYILLIPSSKQNIINLGSTD